MKRAIVYTLIFAGIQMLGGGLVDLAYLLIKGDGINIGATGLIIATALTGVATIIVFLATKWTVVSRHWVQTRPWFVLFWCVMAALGLLIPSTWLQEQMPELPNIAE